MDRLQTTLRGSNIGEIRSGRELGHNTTRRYVWSACIDCGILRWVEYHSGNFSLRCPSCGSRGQRSNWDKGIKTFSGYIWVWVKPDDFFASMIPKRTMCETGGYVPQHRLVMAKHLGRCLHPWEIVHHKNHNKSDNTIDNLQLVSDDRHTQITILENIISKLRIENALLKRQITSMKESVNDKVSAGCI